MASLSRPPHRRKHSTTTNASSPFSSLKNPYEDVLLSSGGKTKFEVHEYAEIFSGSSSIPVLDLSRLDQRAGSGNYPSSKLDYSNIFGGLRDDDVAVSYEELFNGGALKKTETRIPADAQSPFQVSGSLHSSGKMKSSTDEASYQTMDGIKQQFNVSFNKTSQRNSDTSNGKTHIAQLHAVPGFTYFVDGTPRLQKTEGDRPVPSMKCEVSRTWSFSAGVDAVTVEGRLSIEKSHIPNESGNVNEINQKSHISKVPSLPGHTSNPNEKKDLRRSRLPSFASKNSSEKIASEHFSDEELDENSVAAVSAAALKKAIEQAQESIRIAKMIMERKKEGLQVSSKPRSKSHLKVKDNKKTRIGHEIDGLEENNANGRYVRLDTTFPTFTGFDIEFAPSPSNSIKFLNAGKAEVGRVRENVEGAKDHVDALPEVGKKFAPSYSPTKTVHIAKKVDIGQNIEAAEVHGETTNVTGLVANTECRTAISELEKVDKKDDFTGSAYKLASHFEEMETGKETLEQRELTVHQSKEPEVIAELVENASETPLRVQELEKSVDEVMEKRQAAVDSLQGPEDSGELPERVLSCFQSTQEQDEITHDVSENLKTSQDSAVTEERENLADDKGKHEEKSVEHEGMGYWEHLKVLKSGLCNLLNESRSLAKKDILEQEDMKKKSQINPVLKENGQHGKTGDEEEEISKRKSKIFLEVGEVVNKVNVVHELEIDDEKLNCGHEGEIADKCMDTSECEAAESIQMETSNFAEVLKSEHDVYEQKLPREYEQDEIDDRHMDTSEFEASEGIQMEANNCAEVLKSKVPKDAEETDRGAWRTEEDQNEFKFQETASDVENDEVVDAHSNGSGTISSDTHSNDTSTVFSEAQEPRDVELNNKAEEHQAAYKGYGENDRLHRVTETFSVIKDNEAGKVFHLNELKIPGTESLHRYASTENLIGSKLNNAFEGLSSDIRTENVGLMDIDHEETLQKDEDIFKTASEIPTAAKINMQNLHEVHTSNNKVEEFDHINVKPVPERNSESNEGSASTSILEHIDEVSAQEAQVCPENVKDSTSNEEEVKDDLDMTSDEREYVTEQSERLSSGDDREDVYSHSNFELTGIDKSMETGREEETGQNMEKNKENLSETPTVAQKVSTGNEQHSETNDHQRRIEAIKRGREQAKDRLAVERAIREARERAFAEARERAERASVERAAAEAKQRFMTEAREKLEKASIETKQPGGNLSTEAKLRAERAAVERATTEARERALEKAMSLKTCTEARVQGDRYPSERFSSSSRNNGLKHSFSSSDLENFDGTSSESAQRRKARLERHQRIMERAAKALAEKNMRDLLAQREQAERNRLAESLDADIKRWATGKEGNLRALLSTLQYILGSDSGWQPISLTEIITTAAVRKAYRKATLCVHPDKLQQRGASIRQKYICEKVFDLLKAAWNRFNSEER